MKTTQTENLQEIKKLMTKVQRSGDTTDKRVETLALLSLNHVLQYGDIQGINQVQLTGVVKTSFTKLVKPLIDNTFTTKGKVFSKKRDEPLTDVMQVTRLFTDGQIKDMDALRDINIYIKDYKKVINDAKKEQKATEKAEFDRQQEVIKQTKEVEQQQQAFEQNAFSIIQDAIRYGGENISNSDIESLIKSLNALKV